MSKNKSSRANAPAFIDHESLIIEACLDATGEAPEAAAVLSKVGRWLRYGKSKEFALKRSVARTLYTVMVWTVLFCTCIQTPFLLIN